SPTILPPLSLHDALPILGNARGDQIAHLPVGIASDPHKSMLVIGGEHFGCADGQEADAGAIALERDGQVAVIGNVALAHGEESRSEEHTSELQSRENLVC